VVNSSRYAAHTQNPLLFTDQERQTLLIYYNGCTK